MARLIKIVELNLHEKTLYTGVADSLFYLAHVLTITAQGWLKTFPNYTPTSFYLSLQPDGGCKFFANQNGVIQDLYVSSDGEVVQATPLASAVATVDYKAIRATDGQYLWVTQGSNFSLGVIKMDALGSTIWHTILIDSNLYNSVPSIYKGVDGSCFVSATPGTGMNKFWKINANGDVVWEKTNLFGSFINWNSTELAGSPNGGGFIATRIFTPANSNGVNTVARFNANGDVEWQHTSDAWGSEGTFLSRLKAQDEYSCVLLRHETDLIAPYQYYNDMRVIRFDATGPSSELFFANMISYTFNTGNPSGAGITDFALSKINGVYSTAAADVTKHFDGSSARILRLQSPVMYQFPIEATYPLEQGTYSYSQIIGNNEGGYYLAGVRDGILTLLKMDAFGNYFQGSITGRVFIDADLDCQKDSFEIGLEGVHVLDAYLDGNDIAALSDSLGYFSFQTVPDTQYVLPVLPSQYWQYCEDSIQVYLSNDHLDDSVLIPIQPIVDCSYLVTDLAINRIRPCASSIISLKICNLGTSPSSNTIALIDLGDSLNFESASIPPMSQIGNEIVFDLGELPTGDCRFININAIGNCNLQLNEEVCLTAQAYPDSICLLNMTAANRDTVCSFVVNSFDPNDKAASPVGEGPMHYLVNGEEIEYLIRFQNTGNDTAYKVVVEDILSPYLDNSTFKPGVASHPYKMEIKEPGKLSFVFDPIALPDSVHNEPASHGFVKFSIKTNHAVPRGTKLLNNANIYFDNNLPVLTNSVEHTLAKPFMLDSQYVEICAGETWEGIPYFEDAIQMDTFLVNLNVHDYIRIMFIKVLSNWETTSDTILTPPAILFGLPINQSGLYTYTLQASNGCDSIVHFNVQLINATVENANRDEIAIFPNPACNQLNIKMVEPRISGLKIYFSDVLGRRFQYNISTESSSSDSLYLNIENLPPGAYSMSMEVDGFIRHIREVIVVR